MTLISTDVYEDAQYQSDKPIGVQEPIPSGVHDIELSWDRHKGFMRIAIGKKKWWFKEYLGKAVVVGTNNKLGRLHLRASALMDNETLIMYRPSNAEPHSLVEGDRIRVTHNRLCYRRSSEDWRLRDERLQWEDPEALKFVKSYVGDLSAEWETRDRIAHIYHNGYTVIDNEGIAHLYDPDLSYGE